MTDGNHKMLDFKCNSYMTSFSFAFSVLIVVLHANYCMILYRAYTIEWISGMVLFIAGTRAIARGAADSNRANRSRLQLTFKKLLRLARSCIEKLISV